MSKKEQQTSDLGDLTPLLKDIIEVFEKHGYDAPAISLCFTVEDDRRVAHHVTNTDHEGAFKMMYQVVMQMAEEYQEP